ncbi:hypothetical protein CR194_19010 [Salipaludibacillus keqinensis]|uniref:Yip1 domain-containing protein n=1 Tax=Salipaludibacillus keqinensis TaxID=2045207 RepID=A0A323TQW6_9BACI|nr:hypothetical protein [Salipaludibacillus keqinensis]PYZ91715.1 hypothetical protein CR194_19010 [Salipaludibacillus keqinensis]
MIGKMITLHAPAFEAFLGTPKSKLYIRLIIICLGVVYGLAGIAANAVFIASFESALLRSVIVPIIFILFGLFSVWLTKIGLTVLLWAGAKGFGGPGKIKDLNQTTTIALIPGVMAIPVLTGMNTSWFMMGALVIGVSWMFFICVRIHEVTQGFVRWKAYAAVFAVFVFFASVYYIVMPTSIIT